MPDAPFVHVYITRGQLNLEAEGLLGAGDAARLTVAGARRLDAAESLGKLAVTSTPPVGTYPLPDPSSVFTVTVRT